MQRSHMARKHRSAKDNTAEGVFDSGARTSSGGDAFSTADTQSLPKNNKPTRQHTVRHKITDGKASVYLLPVENTGDGNDSGTDSTGHESGDPIEISSAELSPEKVPFQTPSRGLSTMNASAAKTQDAGRQYVEDSANPSTPITTQRAPLRSLKEYEKAHPEDSPDRGGSPSLDKDSSGLGMLMEELLSRQTTGGSDGDDDHCTVDVRSVKGIALMLEVAFADDLQSVLGCIEEYELDLHSVKCVNMSGTSALHAAASGGGLKTARHLVTKACVDVNATDNWGNTPLDEARREGHDELCRFLIAAGGHEGSRSEVFLRPPLSVGRDVDTADASPAHSQNSDSIHGKSRVSDIAYLGLNISPAEIVRAESGHNLVAMASPPISPNAASPKQGVGRRRCSSLSDFCLEKNAVERNMQEESALTDVPTISDASMAALRTATRSVEVFAEEKGDGNGNDENTGSEPSTPPEVQNSPPVSPTRLRGHTFDRPSLHTSLISSSQDEHRDGADEWEVLACDVRVDRKVGEGAFGEIRKATWKGCEVAVKTLKSDCLTDAIAIKEFNREMSIWSRLVHPNIVQFLGVGYKKSIPRIMICEFMEGGSLQQKLMNMNASAKKMLFDQGFNLLKGIASAMVYMHSRRPFAVIHRDLKPANVLLTVSGEAKVADFGLSKMLDIDTPRTPADSPGEGRLKEFPLDDSAHDSNGVNGARTGGSSNGGSTHNTGNHDKEGTNEETSTSKYVPPSPSIFLSPVPANVTRGRMTEKEKAEHDLLEMRRNDYGEKVYSQLYDHSFLMTGETGAYKYMAPEVFKNESYGLKCDVYSFAVIAYEVFEGLMLLRDPVSWAHSASGDEQVRPAWMFLPAYDTRRTTETIELMEQCWHADAKERPTFMKIGSEFRRISRIPRGERSHGSFSKKGKLAMKKGSGGHQTISRKSSGSVPDLNSLDGRTEEKEPQCRCVVM